MFKLFSILMIVVLNSSCLTTWDESVELNSKPKDDAKYYSTYLDASRDFQIVDNFETKYTITATFLTPEFRTAFSTRFESLYAAPQPFLEEASAKMGFFVTIFSPTSRGYDLTDDQLWSIQMRKDERAHKPVLIRKLSRKARWEPFFADVHKWSQEYLVLFDVASVSLSERLVKKEEVMLMFANADAKVKLRW